MVAMGHHAYVTGSLQYLTKPYTGIIQLVRLLPFVLSIFYDYQNIILTF